MGKAKLKLSLLLTCVVSVELAGMSETVGAEELSTVTPGVAAGPCDCSGREPLSSAWWTGPLFAATPATLARGHFDIEPFFYDTLSQGRYDDHWRRVSTPHSSDIQSQWDFMYGLSDDFMLSILPSFGYNGPAHLSTSRIEGGDVTVRLQQKVLTYREGHYVPTLSVAVDETLPTGKYDRLAPDEYGMGTGAYQTTLSLYSQYFLWPGGERILRMRLDTSYSFADHEVGIRGASVYGTDAGFRGHARSGNAVTVDFALEYSLTQRLAPALDVIYRHDDSTGVRGRVATFSGSGPTAFITRDLGSSESLRLAPALEMSWSAHVGTLVGVAFTVAGRNSAATVTPMLAINFSY